MPYDLRFIPPGALVEVTCRTLENRYLLRPSRDLNEIILGVLARAAERHDVQVVAFIYLSNHMHLLLRPRDARELALFMKLLQGQVAREVNRLLRRFGTLWGRRYRAIVVSDEPEAQVARLRYILSQGTKESLVPSPRQWPGVTSIRWLLQGGTIHGTWFSRTAEYEARRRGEKVTRYSHAERHAFELAPLPCWDSLDPAEMRQRIATIVREIEEQARARREADDRPVLGEERILAQDPLGQPARSKRSPAPRFHALAGVVRANLEIAFARFCRAYRQAADDLLAGRPHPKFPPGSFPPALPFCRHGPIPRFPAPA